MASYLRPRRGKKATAVSQNVVLRRGEIFFEVPDTGVGTGNGKIKMGDGTTAYSSLPYFFEPTIVDVATSTIEFTEATETDNAVLLSAISSGAQLKTLIGNIKKLLSNLNTSVTQLNNDFASFNLSKSKIVSSALGIALGLTSNTTIADISTKISNIVNNGAISKTITPSTSSQSYTVPKGYHNGTGKVTVNAAPTSLINGDATEANVLSGKTFFSDSYTAKTGTMTNNGGTTKSATCSLDTTNK